MDVDKVWHEFIKVSHYDGKMKMIVDTEGYYLVQAATRADNGPLGLIFQICGSID